MTEVRIASFQRRMLAKGIDLFLVFSVGVLIPFGVGALIGFLYSLMADAISFKKIKHQSIGKFIFKIYVVNDQSYTPINIKTSVIRNLPIGLVTFFAVFPFWGWILAIVLGIPLFLLELVLMMRAQQRQRIGDAMADTLVIRQSVGGA